MSGLRYLGGLLASLMAVLVPITSLAIPGEARAQAPAEAGAAPEAYWVYVGTYTGGSGKVRSQGIYLMELDARTGTLGKPRLAAASPDPSFLAIHPSRQYLYAVNENGIKGLRGGGVSAFAIDAGQGTLSPINQESSVGDGPCHMVVDRQGKNVLVANYGSGSVACLPIEPNGALLPASSFIQHRGQVADPRRQGGPHGHSINLDAANRFAVAADLGLDKVFVYRFDPEHGKLNPNEPAFAKVAPRSGPRHFAFHPGGRFGYVINEIANTVTAFAYDADAGILTEIQTISTLPEGFKGRTNTAEVQVHPSGKFLYGSNRGHDSIASFAIDPTSGKLTSLGFEPTQGKNPRNFAIDPTGSFLFAENGQSDSIVVFKVDPQTGVLKPTGQTVTIGNPVCIRMIPKPVSATR
jgi:6-phosphogluconolactonase